MGLRPTLIARDTTGTSAWMMKVVYIHIGTHRTGSTALQRFLAKSRNALAQQGIIYPETGHPDTNVSNQYGHHVLHWSLVGKYGDRSDQVWIDLQDEIDRRGGDRVVLSAEGFEGEGSGPGRVGREQIQRITEYLAPHPVRVIVYFRPPLQFLKSAYRKRVAMGTTYRSFPDFVEKMIPRSDYGALVSRWEKVEGIESVDIRLFEKVKNNPGLEADFAEAIGASFRKLKPFVDDPVNTSPPEGLVQFTRWINVAEHIMERLGAGSAWQKFMHRARRNVLGRRTPGRYLVDLWAPFMHEPIVTEEAVSVLRRSLGENHRQFLEEYVPEEDWEHLRLTGKSKRSDSGTVA